MSETPLAIFEDHKIIGRSMVRLFSGLGFAPILINDIAGMDLTMKAQELKALGVLVAIVDGDMDYGKGLEDGIAIIAALKLMGILTIGNSSGGDLGADKEARKGSFDVLVEMVRELQEQAERN